MFGKTFFEVLLNLFFGAIPAIRSNLFARSSQKGFPLLSGLWCAVLGVLC
jgi:hypothetical protein